jgi:hypothetical protein
MESLRGKFHASLPSNYLRCKSAGGVRMNVESDATGIRVRELPIRIEKLLA